MRLPNAVALLALAMLLVITGATTAVAAPVPLDDLPLVVQVWPEGEPGTNVLVVGVELPEGTPLPATVRLPLPVDAQVFWAGEVMGQDPASDIARPHTVVDVEGGRAVEFTVETTLSVQYDATYGTILTDGENLTSRLSWAQTVPSADVSFAFRMPAGINVVAMTPEAPGEPQTNAIGEKLYTLPTVTLATGETYEVEVVYTRGVVQDISGGPPVLTVLGIALVVAVVLLIVTWSSQARRRSVTETHADDE